MTANQLPPLRTPHPTWWKAPLVASAPGLPLLAMEYAVIRAHDGMDQYGGVIYWALALYVLAWALPHRRTFRTPRALAAGAALVITVLPVGLLLLLGGLLAA